LKHITEAFASKAKEDKVFKNFNATVQPETPLFYDMSYFQPANNPFGAFFIAEQ